MNLPVRINPAHRDQGLRLATAAVAGPALLWAGYKYPGSVKAKLALAAVGAALIYANYAVFQEQLQSSGASEPDDVVP